MELEEKRIQALHTLDVHQQQVKKIFDKKATARVYSVGDLVLKWDANKAKLGRHSKFDAKWSGPYIITSYKQANAFQLSRPNSEELPIPVNGIHLKPCF